MKITTEVNKTQVIIDLPGMEEDQYRAVSELLERRLSAPTVKNRDAITDAYLLALHECPTANASDLWHHVIYRSYTEIFTRYRNQDPKQSWVRASGDALEVVLERLYAPVLSPHGIVIKALTGRDQKRSALQAMNLGTLVGDSKLDVVLYLQDDVGSSRIFGGVHVKVSLAERVSDDVPCSRGMRANGFWSPLWTLDVKSFPPPHGNLINRGELGSPDAPTDKRKYVEHHGEFDNCYSANSRTAPSVDQTHSGKRIYVLSLGRQPDQFARDVVIQAESRRA